MNLYTPGEGLLGTHVTWEDIEEDMQRELHTSASFGPNKSATNVGEGKGFASRILLIDPDWQNKDKDLPERFVAKVYFTKDVSETNPTKGYIIMEYVENAKLIHIYENVPVNAIKQMLDMMLGGMQKMGVGHLAEKFEKVQKLIPELLNLAWADQLADELGELGALAVIWSSFKVILGQG
ncbi:hypothetical protein OESDEN_13187 [Oesophagostomum dentatum]|uniref:Protein kinase domain-containing protein n=1 Tax=Oesophagostomum dentatum TaxID=61180 RepID=A0A0B1SU59_OESDE|nr:hypothetical protein OESDEN_13187 [Oesophagostomum dentatum]